MIKNNSLVPPTNSKVDNAINNSPISQFNVKKEPSSSSIRSVPLSMASSSVRCSALSGNNSSNQRKIKLRIADIIFREAH